MFLFISHIQTVHVYKPLREAFIFHQLEVFSFTKKYWEKLIQPREIFK